MLQFTGGRGVRTFGMLIWLKVQSSANKVIVVGNSSNERNITQVQVSPGSKRHGDVPYVKISTTDIGIVKIIDGTPKQYKTDGHEKATIFFRRYP